MCEIQILSFPVCLYQTSEVFTLSLSWHWDVYLILLERLLILTRSTKCQLGVPFSMTISHWTNSYVSEDWWLFAFQVWLIDFSWSVSLILSQLAKLPTNMISCIVWLYRTNVGKLWLTIEIHECCFSRKLHTPTCRYFRCLIYIYMHIWMYTIQANAT